MKADYHDLFTFLESVSRELQSEYNRVQVRVKDDPATAGDQGEENWATVIRGWIPGNYHVVTKGRILGHEGIASPQVDVLILHPSYPRTLVDKKVYLAGGVVAAFECKLTLRLTHLVKAMANSVAIKKLYPTRCGTPRKELSSPLYYGVLAHSHSWTAKAGMSLAKLASTFYSDRVLQPVRHPREVIDVACIADLGTVNCCYIYTRSNKDQSKSINTFYRQQMYDFSQRVNKVTPIGGFLYALLRRLAWDDADLRQLADYFLITGVPGGSAGVGKKSWQIAEIHSPEVTKGLSTRTEGTFDLWDEWALDSFLG